MSQRKNYSRYFIILQEDERGYGLSSDKMPTGYAKLEVKNGKCKITFYVQNLKIEMKPYYIMLVCNKKDEKKLIKLAELNIDNSGRTEITKEFESSNIASSGIAVDKVSGAAVVRFVNDNMTSVLSGFTSTDIPKDWKSYTLIDMTEKRDDEKEHIDNIDEDFDKYEEEIENLKKNDKAIEVKRDVKIKESTSERLSKRKDNHDKSKEEKTHKEIFIEDNAKENRKELIKEEIKEDIKEEIKEDIRSNKKVSEKAKLQEKEHIYNEQKTPRENSFSAKEFKDQEESNKPEKFFNRIIEDLDPFPDDFQEIGKSKWFTVPVSSIEDMYRANSYNKYAIIYYPMINYFPYIIKHGHYIIGYKFDDYHRVKYVMYGIPGTREMEDQPFAGKYGFVSFIKGNEDRNDDLGYWLLFYDFRRAVVVIPTHK